MDRWTMRACTSCGRLNQTDNSLCLFCASPLGESFDVVRAANARTSDPPSSKLAALRQKPRSGSQRAQILDLVHMHGPITAREVGEVARINGAWKRISELVQGGHLVVRRYVHDPVTGTQVAEYALPEQVPWGEGAAEHKQSLF